MYFETFVSRSADDANVFVVNDFQDPLQVYTYYYVLE